jgi:heme exporter protein B
VTEPRLFAALVRWDLVRELRRWNSLVPMALIAFVTLFVFAFAVDPTRIELQRSRGGILWVTLLTSASVGVDRAFRGDGDGRLLEALLVAPVNRATLYHARVVSTFLFVLAMAAAVIPLFFLLYDQSVGAAGACWIGACAALALFGFVAVGVLLSAMTWSLRGGDVLLRVLLFPVLLPAFAAAVDVTTKVLAGHDPGTRPLLLLLAFDLTFLGAGHLLFEHVVKDLGPQG